MAKCLQFIFGDPNKGAVAARTNRHSSRQVQAGNQTGPVAENGGLYSSEGSNSLVKPSEDKDRG